MLYYNLKPIFAARQIEKPYTFLVKIGIAPHTAHKILSSNVHVMRLDNLELICKALYCEPNELLAFKPDALNPIAESHPLNKLIPVQDSTNWEQQIKTLPLTKLKEILNQSNSNKENS